MVPDRLAIVPGLCQATDLGTSPWESPPDVMRGEEIQVLGAMEALNLQQATLVLPGTHSKWVQVHAGRIESFSTHMTGECYQWLRHQSLLARTLPVSDSGSLDREAFSQGVQRALQGEGLLHNAFGTRTLSLFDLAQTERLPDYLSGLVIGEEIRHQRSVDGPVVLIGSTTLLERYQQALSMAQIPSLQAPRQVGYRAIWRLAQSL